MEFKIVSQQSSEFTNKSAQATLFRNVYLWMTLALIITAVTSVLAASSYSLMYAFAKTPAIFYGLIIGEIALVWILSANIKKLSFQVSTLMFVVYSILNGLTLSIIFLVYTSSSIGMTFFVTAATFGAMAIYGTVTKKDLSSLGNILMMALVGIIIASIVNFFLQSETFYWIITYVGVILFVGLTAYDAQKIKNQLSLYGNDINETSQKIALMGALSLYLDFINLFLFLLRILGNRR